MIAEKTVEQRAADLVAELEKLCGDRGAMANLRRGFSPATEDRAWPWIARWCNLANDRQRIIHTTVAAAFATHPQATDRGNMGLVMRAIAQTDQKGEEGLKSFEARFRRFLSCSSAEEVCQRLSGVIRAAAQHNIPVNYKQLFADLTYWSSRGADQVKVRWAAAYWSGQAQGEPT